MTGEFGWLIHAGASSDRPNMSDASHAAVSIPALQGTVCFPRKEKCRPKGQMEENKETGKEFAK